jgi:hypothetical protein
MAHESILNEQKRRCKEATGDKELLLDSLLVGHANCLGSDPVVASPAPLARDATQTILAKVLYQIYESEIRWLYIQRDPGYPHRMTPGHGHLVIVVPLCLYERDFVLR